MTDTIVPSSKPRSTADVRFKEKGRISAALPVELPGIEPVIETNVTCANAELTTRNNAKLRETTCGYAKGVDGVNTRGNERPAAPCTDGRLTAVVQTAGDEVGQPDHAGAADLFAQLAHPRNPFSD